MPAETFTIAKPSAPPLKRDTSQRRRRTRQKILEAAVREFAERGYFDVSMRDIARRAEVSLGLAYHYFGGKEELLRAMIEYVTGVWIDEFNGHMQEHEFATLNDFLTEYLMFMREFIQRKHPEYFRFYMKHIHLDNLPHMDFLFRRLAEIQPYFNEQIAAAYARGEIREGIEEESVAFLVETVSSRIQEAFYSEFLGMDLGLVSMDVNTARDKVTHIVELFLQGITSKNDQAKGATL